MGLANVFAKTKFRYTEVPLYYIIVVARPRAFVLLSSETRTLVSSARILYCVLTEK